MQGKSPATNSAIRKKFPGLPMPSQPNVGIEQRIMGTPQGYQPQPYRQDMFVDKLKQQVQESLQPVKDSLVPPNDGGQILPGIPTPFQNKRYSMKNGNPIDNLTGTPLDRVGGVTEQPGGANYDPSFFLGEMNYWTPEQKQIYRQSTSKQPVGVRPMSGSDRMSLFNK